MMLLVATPSFQTSSQTWKSNLKVGNKVWCLCF